MMVGQPEHRVAFAAVFDDETREHDEVFHRAAAIAPSDRVLDVGCGTGRSTRRAARAAHDGSVLGVDIAAGSIEHARAMSAAEGFDNVTYEVADAQVHPFPDAYFDVCISSFGTMFFTDPRGAFGNIARSLRAGGRLGLLVWQEREANEWAVAIGEAVGRPFDRLPFSLGDPTVVRDVLAAYGDIEFIDVDAPVRYGPDVATAYDFVAGFLSVRTALEDMDDAATIAAQERLRAVIAEHQTGDGVLFGSRAWVITARRY